MRLISTRFGTLRRVHLPGQSIEPAISTKAEFFAPLILTFPDREERPQISNTACGSSGVTLVGLEMELMALTS